MSRRAEGGLPRGAAPLALALLLVLAGGPGLGQTGAPVAPGEDAVTADGARQPVDSDLRERTARRLAQVDVTVDGPDDVVRELTAEDFELIVNGRPIDSFVVDRLCSVDAGMLEAPPAPAGDGDDGDGRPAEAPASGGPPRLDTTFLFYFDQHHLTPAGRQGALDLARELIPDLVEAGHRVSLVSAAEQIETFAELTGDSGTLLAGLARLEGDRDQWGGIRSFEEELRLREVLDILEEGDIERALSAARRYAREEGWRTDRALRRLTMVLGRLADVDPPKAMVYFADTMRRNAGEHYLSFFGRSVTDPDAATSVAGAQIERDAFMAALPFEALIDEAAAHGVRVYSVQAEGLTSESSLLHASTRMTAGGPSSGSTPNQQRIRDAQDSLVGLSAETGGEAFLNGVAAPKIARRILDDLRCLYLLSFDAEGLPLDSPLPIVVRVDRPKVRADARGRLVVQSDEARLTSRLLGAFGDAPDERRDFPVQSVVIPTGFEDGRYKALVQVSVPGSPLSGTVWDLGASLVARGEVHDDVSGRVEVSGPGVPVVLEQPMSFRPGPYELVAVVHEHSGDQLGTSRVSDEWPDPDEAPVTLGPIAVVQQKDAVFLRDGAVRTSGGHALAGAGPASTDSPTLLVGLVCRSRSTTSSLRLERILIGEAEVPFPPQELDLGDQRCALFTDAIHAGTMGSSGMFRYRVRVIAGGEELAATEREFAAVHPDDRDELLSQR